MNRYIDADLLYQTMNGQDEEFSLIDALQMIEDCPTADVRENVHGEWLHEQLIPNTIEKSIPGSAG